MSVEKDLKYWFVLAFVCEEKSYSVIVGFKNQAITRNRIKNAKLELGLDPNKTIIVESSYLGRMTEEEFESEED